MGRPKVRVEDHYIPVPESGCWIWLGGVDQDGYGVMSGNRKAHRESFLKARGPIPDGACICHRCDVRCCINPNHLFVGTPLENNDDKVRKGRHIYGRRTRHVKLTEQQVREIRSSGETCAALAARYGVTAVAVGCARRGKTWKQVHA
jgi:hypothetical protein